MKNAIIKNEILDHINLIKEVEMTMTKQIIELSEQCIKTLRAGNKIILFGNGGSASDAQHIAAEFTGRFRTERKGLAAIALTTDTSALTAIGNDYGFDKIFSRQMEALGQDGDLVIGISTSGNSTNVLNGLDIAKDKGCYTVGLLGNDGGRIKSIVNLSLIIPSNDTARIQEAHIMIGHLLCHMIDVVYNISLV